MIKFEDVRMSYTGKAGCMCGCRGKYQVASHFGVAAANAEVGYTAHEHCSDRSVKSTITKLNEAINWQDPTAVKKHVDDNCIWFDTDTGRTLVVYLMPGAREKILQRIAV
jgi:hypothetical protein